jgi:hypothetical protein
LYLDEGEEAGKDPINELVVIALLIRYADEDFEAEQHDSTGPEACNLST